MADTVKKSRIVSGDECLATFDDEDTSLQDIINQEFNQRLKTCMRDSEENNDSFIEPNAEHIELTYSPNEQNIVLKNGNSDLKKTLSSTPQLSLDLKTKTSDILQEDTSTVLTKKITEEREDSKEDIEEKTVKNGVIENGKIDKEETTHSEETKSHLNDSNGLNHTSDSQHSTEDIPSENLPKEQQKSPEKITSEPLAIEVNKPQDISPEDSFVNKEIPSPEDDIESPFDNVTVTDVDDENLTAKERFLSTVKDLEDDKITIKDRMFLNTESGCLLFTQTVVQSPMLTPTEESYDFLQGIKTSPETNQTSPIKNEEIVPILETLSTNTIEDTCQNNPALNLEPDVSEVSEISAENEVCNRLESSNSEQDISESLKSEEIPENRENIKDLTLQFLQNEIDSEINSKINELKTPTIIEYLVEDIEPNDGDFVENYAEITPDTTKFENSLTEEIKTEITDIDSPEKNNENINIIVEETPEKLLDTPDEIPEELPTEDENIPLEEAKISPTKVSEISKIFTSKDSIEKEEIKSPILEETFEDIKKTKEIFERKSEELKSCDLVKKISGPTSPGSSPDECDNTNIECPNISTTMTSESSFVETRTETNSSQDKVLKKKKSKKSKKDNEKENISVCDYTNTNDDDQLSHVSVKNLKSSFSKFDALQKKTVLHVRSSDSGKAQEKFNGTAQIDTSSCKSCGKQVFQMEQIKAEKAIWHKNCFRCKECNKQLNVDTYQSNEGVLYCKPHFKALFTPKAVEDEPQPTSDKPDLGLEELQNLNVKERFQVFEQHESQDNNLEKSASTVNVKRSPSILSKLAKFQSKGMDIGVADDSLNGVPVEESSSEEDEEEDGQIDGEDAELVRARRAQREKPIHFTNMSDVMSKWESGNQMTKEERREERKQEIQSIRSRLFMGKQAKIKEMYQQAVADSSTHVRKQVPLDAELGESARSLRERFERGEKLTSAEEQTLTELDDASVFESGISKKSRSIFLELDANASKPPILQQQPVAGKGAEVRRARETFMARQASEDVVRSSDQVDDVEVKTADISSRFKFFETYKEPEKQRKEFRITPPRDGTVKLPETPIQDSTPVPSEDDTNVASESHTASRMLSVFRQMEESAGREPVNTGPKPLKRFTPPPEPQRQESESEGEYSEEEDEEEVEEVEERRVVDEDLIEAQKAARAKQLRAKFEKWEANEIKREQNNSSVNIAEEMADADSQIESARSLRARFESMREVSSDKERTPKVKVNRFVDTTNNVEICKSCEGRVYPLEKVSCHNNVYHKNCFRCRECNTVLRMDSYTYNQGLLYCLPHFKRLFISKGNYEAGFGLGQHKEKWNTVA